MRAVHEQEQAINKNYERYYLARENSRVYPTEFVLRTFLSNYPSLKFKKPENGDLVCDVAFGDGRNTLFLCEQGYSVSGVEITKAIVDKTSARLARFGFLPDLRVGRNTSLPFEPGYFDYMLACHCCYYLDEAESFSDNVLEYARCLKPGGYLVASVADINSYIFKNATKLPDGSHRIFGDPYRNRDGYRLQAFSTTREIETAFEQNFSNFSFGSAVNDFYGIDERVFWVVCQKR
jgi:SAM-dependent methyltransferase